MGMRYSPDAYLIINMEYIYNYKGQIVGKIEEKTYITERKPEHFMKIFGGFGISKSILLQLLKKNVNTILIIYHGVKEKKEYVFTLEEYLNRPTNIREDNTSIYTDLQHFVCIHKKKVISNPQKKLSL